MIKLSDMMPDLQKELTVIRAGKSELVRGHVVTQEGTTFKTLAFYAPTKNNINHNFNKNPRIFRNEMEVYTVSNIYEVLEHALVKNDLEFNKNY